MLRLTGDITYISRCGIHFRNARLEPLGLRYRQADMLLKICNTPGISQEDLAKKMVLNKSNITRQLAGLEEEGFVERRPCEKDKRITRLFPSEKTLAIEPEIRQVFRDWNDYLMSALSEEEQTQLKALFATMRARADQWMEEEKNG